MRVKFYIDTAEEIIIEAFYGSISIDTIQKAMPHIWNHPDYSVEYDGIIDFRKSKLEFSKSELYQLIQAMSQDDKVMRGKAAVLVSEPLSAAMATMYGDQMKVIHSVGIFCSESEVFRFLNTDAAIFQKINDVNAVTIDLQ